MERMPCFRFIRGVVWRGCLVLDSYEVVWRGCLVLDSYDEWYVDDVLFYIHIMKWYEEDVLFYIHTRSGMERMSCFRFIS